MNKRIAYRHQNEDNRCRTLRLAAPQQRISDAADEQGYEKEHTHAANRTCSSNDVNRRLV